MKLLRMNIKIVAILIVFILLTNIFIPTIKVFAESDNSSNIIKGTYSFTSNELDNIQVEDTFEYRDDCFTRSSFLGCEHLEILSAQLAEASASRYGIEKDHYEVNPENNSYNIVNFLNSMEFEDVSTNKYYTLEKQINSGGVAVGHKTIIADNKEYTLLVIAPRSAGYKQEWAGNFIVGDGDIHEGFKAARDEMLRYVKQYINENKISGALKIWTAGHSRGSALANLIGGFFAGGGIEYFGNDVSITPEDVYCYTFATPRTIKDGASKNIVLSVEGSRNQEEYVNDTPAEEYKYTKGGTINTKANEYTGIRNMLSSDDIFTKLPLEDWGFIHYGNDLPANHNVVTQEAMLEELEIISPYTYNKYLNSGDPTTFERKTFDLSALSIVKDNNNYSAMDIGSLLKERIDGLAHVAPTNEEYSEFEIEDGTKIGYQYALSSTAGIYGLAERLFDDGFLNDFSVIIQPLIYSYMEYASVELQKEGRANSETEAVSIALLELLEYLTGEELDVNELTIDQFVTFLAKYIYENEDKPVVEKIVSLITNIIPEDYIYFLNIAFSQFSKNSTNDTPAPLNECILEFLKACYNGPDPDSAAVQNFESAKDVRTILYGLTMFISPEISEVFKDDEGEYTASGPFTNFVETILNTIKTEKDENNEVVKVYNTIGELADTKWLIALDTIFSGPIEVSKQRIGDSYQQMLLYHINNMKKNISKFRELLMSSLLYTKDGFNAEMQVKNIATFAGNIGIIPIAHYNEVYLAYAKAAKNYDYGYEKHVGNYECLEGEGQDFNFTNDNNLTFTFNINYVQFLKEGKIFIDNIEVSRDNYIISEGSTIIKFNDEFTNTLSVGSHTLTASTEDGSVDVEFSISDNDNVEVSENSNNTNSKNINTGDGITTYFYVAIISILGIIIIAIYIKKSRI